MSVNLSLRSEIGSWNGFSWEQLASLPIPTELSMCCLHCLSCSRESGGDPKVLTLSLGCSNVPTIPNRSRCLVCQISRSVDAASWPQKMYQYIYRIFLSIGCTPLETAVFTKKLTDWSHLCISYIRKVGAAKLHC